MKNATLTRFICSCLKSAGLNLRSRFVAACNSSGLEYVWYTLARVTNLFIWHQKLASQLEIAVEYSRFCQTVVQACHIQLWYSTRRSGRATPAMASGGLWSPFIFFYPPFMLWSQSLSSNLSTNTTYGCWKWSKWPIKYTGYWGTKCWPSGGVWALTNTPQIGGKNWSVSVLM